MTLKVLFIKLTVDPSLKPEVPVFLASIHVPIKLDLSPHASCLVDSAFSSPASPAPAPIPLPHPHLLKYYFFHSNFKCTPSGLTFLVSLSSGVTLLFSASPGHLPAASDPVSLESQSCLGLSHSLHILNSENHCTTRGHLNLQECHLHHAVSVSNGLGLCESSFALRELCSFTVIHLCTYRFHNYRLGSVPVLNQKNVLP